MTANVSDQILLSMRRLVALQLWQLGAVKINLDQPYKLVSGNYSPIYVNCRQLISSVSFADLFAAAARMICESENVKFDVVAGGETAGIPFAAFLARAFGMPMIYVRKAAKEHGLGSLIEGALTPNAGVLLTEDLITDAGSKLHFIEAIKRAEGTVNDVLVVFDRLQGGREALSRAGIRLHSIADMNSVLSVTRETGLLKQAQHAAVADYLNDAKGWHKKRSLPFIC